jgi:hypothetical protein
VITNSSDDVTAGTAYGSLRRPPGKVATTTPPRARRRPTARRPRLRPTGSTSPAPRASARSSAPGTTSRATGSAHSTTWERARSFSSRWRLASTRGPGAGYSRTMSRWINRVTAAGLHRAAGTSRISPRPRPGR